MDRLACILIFRHVYGGDSRILNITRNEGVGFTWIDGHINEEENGTGENAELLISDDGGMFRRMAGAVYGISDIFSTVDLLRKLGYSTNTDVTSSEKPDETEYKKDRDVLKSKVENALENLAYAEYDLHPLLYPPTDTESIRVIQQTVKKDLDIVKSHVLEMRELLSKYPSQFKPLSSLYMDRQACMQLFESAYGKGAELEDLKRYDKTATTFLSGYVPEHEGYAYIFLEDNGRLKKSADFEIPAEDNPFNMVNSFILAGYMPSALPV